jgi:hypothetical protein
MVIRGSYQKEVGADRWCVFQKYTEKVEKLLDGGVAKEPKYDIFLSAFICDENKNPTWFRNINYISWYSQNIEIAH